MQIQNPISFYIQGTNHHNDPIHKKQKLEKFQILKFNINRELQQQTIKTNVIGSIGLIHSFLFQNPELTIDITTQLSSLFSLVIIRLREILQKINPIYQCQVIKTNQQIAHSIIFLLSTLIVSQNNHLKKNPELKKWLPKIFDSKIILDIVNKDYLYKRKLILKPIGLILGSLSQQKFSMEDRFTIKQYLLKNIEHLQEPKLKYWFILSLHRIVTESNVKQSEFRDFNIIKILIESLISSSISFQQKYYLKIIVCIAQAHPNLIASFYQQGLLQKITELCKSSPKILFNFLEKLHGNHFKKEFPQQLTQFFTQNILTLPYQTNEDIIKISLKILRYKFYSFEYQQIDFLEAIQNGFIQRLCDLIKLHILRIKYICYTIVQNIFEYSRIKMDRFSEAIIQKFDAQGLGEILSLDLMGNIEDIRHLVLTLRAYFI